MGIIQKPDEVVAYNSPGRFLLLKGWTVLVILRYVIEDRYVRKSLYYQSNISQMERPLVNILENGEVKVKHKIWVVFFIWSTECAEKTDFGQLMISLSNEAGNSLWYNYTVKGQNQISLA